MSRRTHGWLGLALALACSAAAGARAQDFDRDGLLDAGDNCPTVANAGQEDRGGLASYQPNGSGDLCECGDANGDGAAHLNDATLIRRQFAGLGPGLARPELCNVAGAPDAGDADGDGLRDDCNLVDLVVLRRAFLGLAPGRGSACGNVAPADQVAPTVELIAPERVTAGQPFAVRALARDDVGVGRVVLLVDGIAASEIAGPELAFDVTAPGLPGAALALRAEAFDAAGNRGEAGASVAVEAAPDVTAPSVTLLAPPTAAPGSAVGLAATAVDDRGVALVRFLRGGELIATDATAPYEAALAIDPGAEPDTLVALAAEAVDAEGNTGRADTSLRVVANADTAAPTNVVVSAPARALAGQTVRASANAADDVGILAIEFFVDGAPVGSDAQPPYEASFAIPAGTAPGTSLRWSARAVDFSSNAATSPEVQTLVAAPGRALVVGEVYDDTRSQPLSGARVRVEGSATEVTTDGRGRFALDLPERPARLLVSREGWSDAQRSITVPAGGVLTPLDCRLTPRAPASRVGPEAGSTVSSAGGSVSVALPAGALPAETDLRVTPLSEQGLPAPLPPGWAPLAAVEIAPSDLALALPAVIRFRGVGTPPGALAVRFDAGSGVWRRVESSPGEVSAAGFGAIAIVVSDTPGEAPAAAVGGELPGMPPASLPANATAEILPSPRVLFLSPDARSEVEAALDTPAALPSGTPLAVRFAESYDRTDGTRLAGESSTQDVLLYRRPAGLRAAFPATPSEIFDAALLREGVIDLAALAGAPGARTRLDAAGGALSTPDGVGVEVPAGALPAPTPVALSRVAGLDPALASDARLGFAGGLALDLGGATPAAPVVLRLTPATPSAPGESALVVRRTRVRESTRFEWVGIADAEGAELVLRPGALGLPLPGANAEGVYLFVRLAVPAAFAAGVVAPPAAAALGLALAETPSLPFVSLADAADPRYALVVALGATSVVATDLQSGATGSAALNAGVAGAIVSADLALATARPAVASVTPADLARQVDVDTAVTVAFTRPIDAQSLTPDTFRLLDGAATVAGALFVAADGRSATFRPAAPLRGLAPYTVAVGPEVFDVFGNALLGNQADGSFLSAFETFDTAPPPRPAAGRITLSIPRDGETDIRGSIGSVAEGTLVFAFNRTSGAATVAVAVADGSFEALLGAERGDEIALALQSLAGQVTELDPVPFTDPDGSAILGPRGGRIESAAGIELSVLPGSLTRADEVRLTDLAATELPSDLPGGLTLLRAFRLEVAPALVHTIARLELVEETGRIVGAERAATPLRLGAARVSAAGTTSTTRFAFVARAADAQGVLRTVRVDATGSATPCSGVASATHDASAPRLRLSAPSCLGPSQPFRVDVEAIQPRFDVATAAAPGDTPGAQYLLLERVQAGADAIWSLVETARVETQLGAPRVTSDSRTPFGLRSSGEYAIARADTPLAFLEGSTGGDASLVATDLSALGARTSGHNGAFLLALPAGEAFTLRTLSPGDGSQTSERTLGALDAGATETVGPIGSVAAAPLVVAATPADGGTVSPNTPIVFGFSEPVDPASLTRSSVFALDPDGRLVDAELVPLSGGALLELRPRLAWRAGATYAWRVTSDVVAQSGARLIADATGSFSGFQPTLLTTISGTDVRDAVARGGAIHLLDANRLRSVAIAPPAATQEGPPLALSPAPNRVALASNGASLLVSAGGSADHGEVVRLDFPEGPLAPTLRARLRVTTPAGAEPAPSAATVPGTPAALAPLADSVSVSTHGVGLQRVALTALDGAAPAGSTPSFPAGGATFADVASLAPWLASLGPSGLQLHDPVSLAPLAEAAVDGSPADVELAQLGGRTLALVAAGLPGGLQVFEISQTAQDAAEEDAPPIVTTALRRIAKILPGCAARRVAADSALARAWLACSGTRIASVDLDHVDGLERIDTDGDGSDDRMGAPLSLPLPLVEFSLDAPRNVGLVSAGAAGLGVVVLGGAEARIADVVRDPLTADLGDAESILAGSRAYFGDAAIRVSLDARIPPGHAGLRAIADGAVAFADGSRELALAPGRNELALQPPRSAGGAQGFGLRVIEPQGAVLASFAGEVERVPEQDLLTVYAPNPALAVAGSAAAPLTLVGRTADGRFFDVAPLAEFEVERAAIGGVDATGAFLGAGGGQTDVRFRVGEFFGSLSVEVALPPALERIELEPRQSALRAAGETLALRVRGHFTDGTSRDLDPSSVVWTSLAPAVASVDASGTVRAQSDGAAEIRAATAGVTGSAFTSVAIFVAPDLAALELEPVPDPIASDHGVLAARAFVRGSGSLDRIPVRFRLEGFGAPQEVEIPTRASGLAEHAFDGLSQPGQGTLSASAVDPGSGEPLAASIPVAVIGRNMDLEPNQAPAQAVPIGDDSSVEGSASADSDSTDRYLVDLLQEGTLLAELALDPESEGDARLVLEDASGVTLVAADTIAGAAEIRASVAAAQHLLRVEAVSGTPVYRLRTQVSPLAPRIDGVEPSAAPPGSAVVIRGAGFSRDPERNTVTFNGVLTEVTAAAPDRIDVIVPAFATDGPLVVGAGGRSSAPVPFATGAQGDPAALAFTTPEDPSRYVDGDEGRVLDNRVLVAFRAAVQRSEAEAVASQFGATVVGLMPAVNWYVLEFSDTSGAGEIEARRRALEARAEVRYAALYDEISLDGFSIAVRDTVTSDARRDLRAAYDQVNAFEAYEAVARTGRFEARSDYGNGGLIEAAVIDYDYEPGAAAPRFDQFVEHVSLGTGNCPERVDASGRPALHATLVAGTLGARNLRTSASVQHNGVAAGSVRPEILPPYRVTVIDMCTRTQLEYALTLRPHAFDVVNISLSLKRGMRDIGRLANVDVWRDIIRLHPTALFVVSAGNYNERLPNVLRFPARMNQDATVGDRVVTVAATGVGVVGSGNTVPPCTLSPGSGCDRNIDVQAATAMDQGADTRAVFSNYGQVDIAAPGVSVPSVQTLFDSIQLWEGTSGSAPMVAGTAVLLKAVLPSLDARALKRMLIDTATPIGAVPKPPVNDAAGNPYQDGSPPANGFGWGGWSPVRLDMLAAVNRALACRDAAVTPCPAMPTPALVGSGPLAAPAFSPGRRRGVWVPDSIATRLFNLRLPPVVSAVGPFDQQAANAECALPSGVEFAPDGDEIYVACRGKLAVVNAQTRGQGGVREIGIGQNNQLSFVAQRVKLAVSPDGSLVAAPVIENGQRAVLIADALSERFVTRVFLPVSIPSSNDAVPGNPAAVAFDLDSNLYVVTTEPPSIGTKQKGALLRIPRRPGADRLAPDQFDASAAAGVLLEHDEPLGLEFQRVGSNTFLYVHYGGDRSIVSATIHNPSTLASVGSVAARLPNHRIVLVPGQLVTGTPRIHDVTSTNRAFGLEIDQDSGSRGYVLYFWTGNLALLRPSPSAPFDRLRAATRIEGAVGRDLEFAFSVDPTALAGLIPQDPQLPGAGADPKLAASKVPAYETNTFATSLDLEQGGDLLAAGYVSRQGFVRLFFRSALDLAFDNLDGADPRTTPLADLAPQFGNVIDVDIPVTGMVAPRDVAFTPQLVVVNPKPSEITAGAVPVHVVLRDASVERLRCTLRQGTTSLPGAVTQGSGTLSPQQQDLGLAWIPAASGSTAQRPLCVLVPPGTGDYQLEVRGTKSGGQDVIARVPFRYQR